MVAAHVSGMVHGIQLHAKWDNRALQAIFSVESPYAESSGEHELALGTPSMKAFYDNLGRVSRGEWWFYDNTTSPSEYKEFRDANGETGLAEADYFWMLSAFLSFDQFKYAAAACGTKDPEVITSMFSSTSYVMESSKAFGIPMPAERFLEMYNTMKSEGPPRTMKGCAYENK